MKSTLNQLEDIFNSIPKDGSNIRAEEDDDNGYASLSGDTSTTFDTKAGELSEKVAQTPQGKSLPLTETQETPPTPPAPVQPSPTPAADLDAVIVAAVEESKQEPPLSVGDALEIVHDAEYRLDCDPNATQEEYAALEEMKQVALSGKAQTPPYVISTDTIPASRCEGGQVDLAGIAHVVKSVVAAAVPAVIPPAPEAPPKAVKENAPVVVKTGAETVDREVSDEDKFDEDGWKLTTTVKQYEQFYHQKWWCLKRLLPNGRLPFEKWRVELTESKAQVECSYDTTAMFEQMKYIQSLKVRVTDIIVQLNSQYFKWKRFMAVLRAEAARMEGTKVAQSDAAALRHLRDFEDYFGDLEGLMETAEGVMRNLESGWDTLNRGVTIVLQAQGHDRGMTRYADSHGFVPPQVKQQQFSAEMKNFDSLDAATPNQPPKKKGSDDWDVVR